MKFVFVPKNKGSWWSNTMHDKLDCDV